MSISGPLSLPAPGTPSALRRQGATMFRSDAATRLGLTLDEAKRLFTRLPMPGRPRVATAQVEAFEEWVANHAKKRPWIQHQAAGAVAKITRSPEYQAKA